MLPHLNHSKGNIVDIAFFWQNPESKARTSPPSPLGYYGYTQPQTPRICDPQDLPRIFGRVALDMRWDFEWYQQLLPKAELNTMLTRTMIGLLDDQQATTRITLEPHLHKRLASPKTIVNPCSQARHDDHIHVRF